MEWINSEAIIGGGLVTLRTVYEEDSWRCFIIGKEKRRLKRGYDSEAAAQAALESWYQGWKKKLNGGLKETKISIIVAKIEAEEQHCLLGFSHLCETNALITNARLAVRAYLQTDEGKAIADSQSGDFNWGDAVSEVPLSIWNAHDIEEVWLEDSRAIVVNHDESLA